MDYLALFTYERPIYGKVIHSSIHYKITSLIEANQGGNLREGRARNYLQTPDCATLRPSWAQERVLSQVVPDL